MSGEIEQVFNQWSKLKITEKQVKKWVRMAMVPNMETLENIQKGRPDEFLSLFSIIMVGQVV